MADVVELIEHDHREVEALFSRFKSTGDPSVAIQICDELDRHTAGEEEAVYPVIASDVPGGAKMVKEAFDEHKEARQLIGRIRNTSEAAHLNELMGELQGDIEHHVQVEETEVLPATKTALDQQRLNELGSEFEAAKEAARR